MSDTLSILINDINASLPERKLAQAIEKTAISADTKAILIDLSRITMKIGGKVVAIGRKILAFVLDLLKAFPAITMGILVALVISSLIAAVPLIGPPLAGVLTPLLLALGIGAGALKDFASDDLKKRIDTLASSFSAIFKA